MTPPEAAPAGIVTAIYVYAVKGCAAVSLPESAIEPSGLAHDRRWMIVDGTGRFLSQRTHPRLALVLPSIDGDSLTLSAPEMPSLRRPLRPLLGLHRRVSIWADRCEALEDPERSAWFTSYLGIECSAVFGDPLARTSPAGGAIAFPDEYPLLLTSAASLDDLNARLPHPVTMARFRPSLVVSAPAAFVEDSWSDLRAGSVALHVRERCARCAVIEIDPQTAVSSPGPLRALAAYRKGERGVSFGVYLTVRAPGGTIRVGDPVTSLSRAA